MVKIDAQKSPSGEIHFAEASPAPGRRNPFRRKSAPLGLKLMRQDPFREIA
jgi:hypothetical protein